MSPVGVGGLNTGEPEPIWDAALALANEEEGLVRDRAVVGEPAEIGVFAWRLAHSPPEKQRQMLKSRTVPAGVLELLRVGVDSPKLMLKWLVERVDAQLPWAELSDALRGFDFDDGQSLPAEPQLSGAAARLLPRIDWFVPFTRDVFVELIRSGRGALVAEVLQSAPFDLSFRSSEDLEIIKIGAHALLLGEEAVVRAVLGLSGDPETNRRAIGWANVQVLGEMGRSGVALALAALEGVWSVGACDRTQGDEAEAFRLSAALQRIAETTEGMRPPSASVCVDMT
jgi:hypothetical protein